VAQRMIVRYTHRMAALVVVRRVLNHPMIDYPCDRILPEPCEKYNCRCADYQPSVSGVFGKMPVSLMMYRSRTDEGRNLLYFRARTDVYSLV